MTPEQTALTLAAWTTEMLSFLGFDVNIAIKPTSREGVLDLAQLSMGIQRAMPLLAGLSKNVANADSRRASITRPG